MPIAADHGYVIARFTRTPADTRVPSAFAALGTTRSSAVKCGRPRGSGRRSSAPQGALTRDSLPERYAISAAAGRAHGRARSPVRPSSWYQTRWPGAEPRSSGSQHTANFLLFRAMAGLEPRNGAAVLASARLGLASADRPAFPSPQCRAPRRPVNRLAAAALAVPARPAREQRLPPARGRWNKYFGTNPPVTASKADQLADASGVAPQEPRRR